MNARNGQNCGLIVEGGRRGLMDSTKDKTDNQNWFWINAPITIPELGIHKGDLLLVNIQTGQILGAERSY